MLLLFQQALNRGDPGKFCLKAALLTPEIAAESPNPGNFKTVSLTCNATNWWEAYAGAAPTFFQVRPR